MTAELFIDLCESKEFIEEKFYDYIVAFKNQFFENIQYPALFGKTALSKKDMIIEQLDELLEKLEDKISEIKAFLETEEE